jgi:hypothetical protein
MPWLAIVGAAVGMAGQLKQGQATAAANEFNADMTRTNTAIEIEGMKRKYGRLKGTQEAVNAVSGVAESGSFLELMADQAYEAERDILLTRWKGETQATISEQAAKDARTESYIKAGSTLLSSVSDYGMMKSGYTKYGYGSNNRIKAPPGVIE